VEVSFNGIWAATLGCYIIGNQCAVRFICVKDSGVDRHWKLEDKRKRKRRQVRREKDNVSALIA